MAGLIPGDTKQPSNAVMETPLPIATNRLAIRTANSKLQALSFVSGKTPLKAPADAFTRQVVSQLKQYFADPAFEFKLETELDGTTYQQRVWQELLKCAPGTVWSYGELAQRIHSAPRAVGGACRRNPVPIVVPCHRVVAASGLGGYAGKTGGAFMAIKQWLLQHESAR
ncbi:MAG: methylated-DNA--[protein]-cysteine S-methyltransferase [Gammaproteobacteria bacterium]|jgi:methylated-DNA-[protein]-cysteine S-methyltransferase